MITRACAAVLTVGLALSPPGHARAAELLVLAEDVPVGLDYDGPAVSVNTSQVGFINLMEPMIDYPMADKPNEDSIRSLDFTKFQGRLIESWDHDLATHSWTMHLRHGVKSCAGNEFTADDVIYTLARGKSVSGTAPINWFLGSLGSIDGFDRSVFSGGSKELGDAVTKIDDHTVRIRQSSDNALLLTVMTVYSMAAWDSVEMKKHATPEDPWSHVYANTVNSPGFGAYCLENWVKDDQFVMRANPDYYRGKPAIDRVVIKRVPQSSNRALTLRSGQAQLTQRLSAREFDSLRRASGVKVAGIYGNEVLALNLNFKTPPFDNPKLRQAFAAAMPYKQIISIGYSGQARKWDAQYTEFLNGFIKPKAQYDQDLAKAKQLLAEAGFPGGKGLEQYASAMRLTFVSERESFLGPIATAIRSALGDAGIPIELDPLPQTQMNDRKFVKKDLPIGLSDTEKPVGPDVLYATKLFFVSPGAGGVNNMVNYANPAMDKLFADALVEPDAGKRQAMEAQIQEIVQDDLAWVPLVQTKTQWAFSDKLHGITWHPDNAIRFFELSLDP